MSKPRCISLVKCSLNNTRLFTVWLNFVLLISFSCNADHIVLAKPRLNKHGWIAAWERAALRFWKRLLFCSIILGWYLDYKGRLPWHAAVPRYAFATCDLPSPTLALLVLLEPKGGSPSRAPCTCASRCVATAAASPRWAPPPLSACSCMLAPSSRECLSVKRPATLVEGLRLPGTPWRPPLFWRGLGILSV